jgi:uncharacterized protein YegP (UPF0339 family)
MAGRCKWEFYKDREGKYRWRKIASNGEKVGASRNNARLMGYEGS